MIDALICAGIAKFRAARRVRRDGAGRAWCFGDGNDALGIRRAFRNAINNARTTTLIHESGGNP